MTSEGHLPKASVALCCPCTNRVAGSAERDVCDAGRTRAGKTGRRCSERQDTCPRFWYSAHRSRPIGTAWYEARKVLSSKQPIFIIAGNQPVRLTIRWNTGPQPTLYLL
jgi:hypothetical protein